tara:strand:- start:70 stop:261 length:192 start_codon:yes stop_codon:yes gene_type:complete
MPGNWTPEKKEAQSQKLKEYWKRRKAAEQRIAEARTKAQAPARDEGGFFKSVLGFVKGTSRNA